MPIPDFDHNHVLPPFINGDPSVSTNQSPYKCGIMEFCERFSFTKHRINILKNFVSYRIKLHEIEITEGFQYVDGSFIENKEAAAGLPPGDIDIATFYFVNSKRTQALAGVKFPEFCDRVLTKQKYEIDDLVFDISIGVKNPYKLINYTNFITSLFSYSRRDYRKGMVEIKLNTVAEDRAALVYLNSL